MEQTNRGELFSAAVEEVARSLGEIGCDNLEEGEIHLAVDAILKNKEETEISITVASHATEYHAAKLILSIINEFGVNKVAFAMMLLGMGEKDSEND